MEIQAQLEDISSVKKKLTIEVPSEVAGETFEQLARDFRKYARIPGFRPGKAPLQLVKRRFFDDIRGELLQKLVPDSYNRAVDQQQVHPLGRPELENIQFQEGQPLRYEAVFEVRPEIELPRYQKLTATVESVTLSDEEVERELETLRQRHASLTPVDDRPAEAGDFVTIDLKGSYLDEGPSQPIDEEGVVVELGSERVHPAFNEHLPGLGIGEEAAFDIQYEDDYPEEKLAGRHVSFRAEVTDVKRSELPALNDDFARDVGEFESMEQLRDAVRGGMEQQLEGKRQHDIQKALIDQLLEQTDFEVPEVLIESRIDMRVRDLAYNIASRGVDPTRSNVNWRGMRDEFRDDAEKEARANLLLEEIARQEKLEVAPQEVEAELEGMAAELQQPIEKVRQHFGEEGRLEGLQMQMLRRKALAVIVDAASVQ